MSDWESLRKHARTLENEIDLKLVSYSKLGTTISQTSNDASAAGALESQPLMAKTDHISTTMEKETESLINKLSEVNDRMAQVMGNSGGASNMHTLQRHREILREYRQEFNKTKSNIKALREHAELLSSVKRDADSYKNGTNASRTDNLLRERNAIGLGDREADDVIGKASAAREMLRQQRTAFGNMMGKIGTVGSGLPVIGTLIGNINNRRTRDQMILGTIIGILGCIILYMTFLR